MAAAAIASRRLAGQRLTQQPCATPAEVVAWLGAVQGQDFLGTLWALSLRMVGATEDVVERAFTEGSILRTHVLRPTWHFVTPADIRWLLALTAPRVHIASGYQYRRLELDDALTQRTNAVIADALRGGSLLTRVELGKALERAGINTTGLRLTYMMFRAELDGVICSGPRRGKQFTYALLDERVPPAARLTRDAALAELTRRYFTSHGPATVRDFVWWSGLTMADANAGLEMAAAHLAREALDGQTYWFGASMPPLAQPAHAALLLPTFDEFLVGYDDFGKSMRGGHDMPANSPFSSTIVIDGRVVGHWKRTLQRGKVIIERALFAPLSPADEAAVTAAAKRYGQFLGREVELA